MIDIAHLCGCHIDPRETDRVCNALAKAGCNPCAADKPGLKGTWARKKYAPMFLTDADDSPAWSQNSGTCCGQGWGHALQTMIRYSIKFGERLGDASIEVAWEPLYILARTVIGRMGPGDGAYVPHLAQAAYEYGLLKRGSYSVDLSGPQEPWAVNLSQPRARSLPSDVLAAMKDFPIKAAFQVKDLDTAADCVAAGYALVRGADRATGSVRDQNGMTGTVECGGHCEHIPLVFIDHKGDRIWGERNSWKGAASQPHGGGTFKLKDGSEHAVPDGVGGIRDEDVQYYIDTGDLWTCEPPDTLWGTAQVKASDL